MVFGEKAWCIPSLEARRQTKRVCRRRPHRPSYLSRETPGKARTSRKSQQEPASASGPTDEGGVGAHPSSDDALDNFLAMILSPTSSSSSS